MNPDKVLIFSEKSLADHSLNIIRFLHNTKIIILLERIYTLQVYIYQIVNYRNLEPMKVSLHVLLCPDWMLVNTGFLPHLVNFLQ